MLLGIFKLFLFRSFIFASDTRFNDDDSLFSAAASVSVAAEESEQEEGDVGTTCRRMRTRDELARSWPGPYQCRPTDEEGFCARYLWGKYVLFVALVFLERARAFHASLFNTVACGKFSSVPTMQGRGNVASFVSSPEAYTQFVVHAQS